MTHGPRMPSPAEETCVVVTGSGLVTCLGLDRRSTWEAVKQGRCGISALTAIESRLAVNKGGGQAPELSDPSLRGKPRETAYLALAMREALSEALAGRALPYRPERCGVLLGTTLHGMRSGGEFLRSGDHGKLAGFPAGAVLRGAAEELGLSGLATTVSSACSSGLASIAMAVTLLESGLLDLIVAGGYDSISEYAYGGFDSMRLVSSGVARPFDRERDGLKLGEGYGLVVLELEADAVRRQASIHARILGVGESCDAFHLSKPHPEGHGAATAMASAVTDAGIEVGRIDLIAAHGTATPDNDSAELAAMASVFGSALRRIPVVAFKSHLGHTLGAAGAVELILSIQALREQVVPPCATPSGPVSILDGVQLTRGRAEPSKLRYALNTSLGFGGANACLVIGSATPASVTEPRGPVTDSHKEQSSVPAMGKAMPPTTSSSRVVITGVGALFPGLVSQGEFAAHLCSSRATGHEVDTGGITTEEISHLLNARRVRRMSEYAKLSLAATTAAVRDAGLHDAGSFGEAGAAVLATAHGSTGYCERYYKQIVDDGIAAANPLLFAEGVPNAAAAHISTMLSLKEFCLTVIGTRTAGLDALVLAAARIISGRWRRCIVCAADEFSPVVNSAYGHFGLYRRDGRRGARPGGFVVGSGAVALILEDENTAVARGATVRGAIEATATGSALRTAGWNRVAAAQRVIEEIGRPRHLVGSANDTWVDRVEELAVRRAYGLGSSRHESRGQESRGHESRCGILTRIYGHVAECFAALPLAGLAGVLLAGRMPSRIGNTDAAQRGTSGDGRLDSFGILATDYHGPVTAVRVRVGSGGAGTCRGSVAARDD